MACKTSWWISHTNMYKHSVQAVPVAEVAIRTKNVLRNNSNAVTLCTALQLDPLQPGDSVILRPVSFSHKVWMRAQVTLKLDKKSNITQTEKVSLVCQNWLYLKKIPTLAQPDTTSLVDVNRWTNSRIKEDSPRGSTQKAVDSPRRLQGPRLWELDQESSCFQIAAASIILHYINYIILHKYSPLYLLNIAIFHLYIGWSTKNDWKLNL